MLYEGRNSNTLQSAEIENYFAELRTDVEAAYYAFYFLEFADFYTREANDEREMLKLLYQTMRVLTKLQGVQAPASGLFGRLAPFANADIFPFSFVRITTLLSYSPIGATDRIIPVIVVN